MIIVKNIKEDKGNKFLVSLNNGDKIQLYDETILKFHLNDGAVIDSINKIKRYNDLMSLYFVYVKKLSKKKISEMNFNLLLGDKKIDFEERKIIIDKLKVINLLNDKDYVTSYINDCINLKNDGPNKIKNSLIRDGIDLDITIFLDDIDTEIWNKKIDKIVLKKIKANHVYSNLVLYEKIKVYLSEIGYENFLDKIKLSNDQEIDNLKAIYDKLIRQGLSEDEIILKMRKKRFLIENINFIINENKD